MSPEGTLGSPPSFRLAKVFQNEAHLGRRTKTVVQLVTRKTQMYAVCALLTPCTQLPMFFQNRLLCGIFFFLCTRNTLLAKISLFAACMFYGFRLDPLKGS